MQQITSSDDVKQLGTIMFIAAHPDDETFTAGGLFAAAAQNGQTVIVITATKGEGGVQDENRWPAAQLAEVRAAELKNALHILDCQHQHYLGYRDGDCSNIPDANAVERIKEFITQYQPDTILTFGPDGLTGHPDHQTVSRWAALANDGKAQIYHVVEEQDGYEKYLSRAGQQFNWYFNIPNPPLKLSAECEVALKLTPELRQKKLEALQAMPSQYEKFFRDVPQDLLDNIFTTECFVKA